MDVFIDVFVLLNVESIAHSGGVVNLLFYSVKWDIADVREGD
jgi:hypothetical protein